MSSALVKIKGHSTQKTVGTMSACEEGELEDAIDRLVQELLQCCILYPENEIEVSS